MLTFKDNNGDWRAPTECIPINNCCTVKSADDELNMKNTFVSNLISFLSKQKIENDLYLFLVFRNY